MTHNLTFPDKAIYIGLIFLFFILNILKPWIDFYLNISNQTITGLQTILLSTLVLVAALNHKNYQTISSIFLLFIGMRLASDLIVYILEGAELSVYLAAVYSGFRFVLLIGLVAFFNSHSDVWHSEISKIFMIFFALTTIYSLLQHPLVGNNEILRNYGGNVMSGNALEFHRVNGGLGGTVISYANYLLGVAWVIFAMKTDNLSVKAFWLLLLGIAVFLCFSRSLFLALFIFIIGFLIYRRMILSLSFAVVSICTFLVWYWPKIYEIYTTIAGTSDVKRLEGWRLIYEKMGALEFVLGSQVGRNTGLMAEGVKKISGDGFLIGVLHDFGLVGLVLFTLLIWRFIRFQIYGLYISIAVFLSFMVMVTVNSGFEKLLVMFVFMTAIYLVGERTRTG